MLKALFQPGAQPHRSFLAIFILVGIVITLTCTIPSDISDYNNAVWFYAVSKMVAWVFVVEVVWKLIQGRSRALQVLVVGLVVALSVPSTLQTMAKLMHFRLEAIGKDVVEMTQHLGKACRPGDVVFCAERVNMIVVSLTTCRTPFADIARTYAFSPPSEVAQRQKDFKAFWTAALTGDLRREILSRYNVDYLIVQKKVRKESALLASVNRRPVFENDRFVVYQER
jgi:hypothetical protein